MKKVLHMIGNAHIDPVWLWRWQDGFSEIRATFRSALDRMEEYPDFIFTCAAASFYQWIEQNDPQMFVEIQARVKDGRWKIVGGWWIQPDCNIPCGESLARQALYGQRYFQEKFGVTAKTGYNVDSFGHTGSLPKILRMSGMENYVYMRPGIHEKSYPAWTFQWQSPEGDEVTAFRIPFEYCTWGKELSSHITCCAQEIRDENGMMCFYGVGNHGGGPTKENLDSIAALDGNDGVELRLSSPDQYFESMSCHELPVVNGDLLHHASGCYAAHSGVKRWNRQAENRLITAEKWSAAAYGLLGKVYPKKEYEKAWKKVLFNQFHDTLAGTSLYEAYQDAQEDYGYALSVGAEHLNDALQALMAQMEIPFLQDSRPYVVFNPHGFSAKSPVILETPAISKPMRLFDSSGHEVPFQMTPGSAAAMGRSRLNFIADVPAMGWQVYRLVPIAQEMPSVSTDPSLTLENDLVRGLFDPEKGLHSIYLKDTETELLREQAKALVIDDPSDTWSHSIIRFDKLLQEMALTDVRVTANGPVLKTIRATYTYQSSTLIQEYTLYQGLPQIYLRCRLDWQETQKLLKLRFPTAHNYSHVCAQSPFGYADRNLDGEEYPMQQWVDLTGIIRGDGQLSTGLAVLNDGKYSYSAENRGLNITVARSPYYANHEPFIVEDGMDYPVVDKGVQEFTLALLPHNGGFYEGGVEEAAMLLNAPMIILPESYHTKGTLSPKGCFLSLTAQHAVVDAIKIAEGNEDILIVHLHETARKEEHATLHLSLWERDIPIHLNPGEIKSIALHLKNGDVIETDLIETGI